MFTLYYIWTTYTQADREKISSSVLACEMDRKSDNEITFSDEGGYLLAAIRGPWNPEIIEEFIIEIRQRSEKSEYKCALVDALGPATIKDVSIKRLVIRHF